MSHHRRPANILILVCDQLSAQALPAWGNTDANTPNINRLIARGLRFESAFSNCPLCQPSRASFWTGRYPHQTGVLSNGRLFPVTPIGEDVPTLGETFATAGYRTMHFGKCHDAGALRGFECAKVEREFVDVTDPSLPVDYDTEQDRDTTNKIVDWLKAYNGAPFLAVADLQNPHDICNWIGKFENELVPDVTDVLPALPGNLYRTKEEFLKLPLPIQYLCCAHNRQAQMAQWDETKIRHYLRAYHHYVSPVDAEIGRILSALESRADGHNTMVVFFSDHGDSMAGRWMATKHTSFYEETVHVPFVFSGPGISGEGRSDKSLVALLDLLPTLCDYANLPVPQGMSGVSLCPQLRGEPGVSRDHVVSEWHTEWGYTIEPGRMIRTHRYKYTHYLEGAGEELYDLDVDPDEVHNLAGESNYSEILEEHRKILHKHTIETNDSYYNLEWKVDARWRSHSPGYTRHRGPTAPRAHKTS